MDGTDSNRRLLIPTLVLYMDESRYDPFVASPGRSTELQAPSFSLQQMDFVSPADMSVRQSGKQYLITFLH